MDREIQVACFWDKFIYKTTTCDVKGQHVRWYGIHAENYIKDHAHHLAKHECEDVKKYLSLPRLSPQRSVRL